MADPDFEVAYTPEQIDRLRAAYGGTAKAEARAMGDQAADAKASRMADWANQVEADRIRQEADFAARREAAAPAPAEVVYSPEQIMRLKKAYGGAAIAKEDAALEADAAAQEAHARETAAAEPLWSQQAMRLREAARLPTAGYGPTPQEAALSAQLGAPVALRAAEAPTLAAPVPVPVQGGMAAKVERAMGGAEAMPAAQAAAAPVAEAVAPPPVAPAAPSPPAGAPARFAKTAPGGGGPPGVDLDWWNAITEEERRANSEKLKGTPYSRTPATPQREQAQHVVRERQLGYDPGLLAEQQALETGPAALTEITPREAPKLTYDPAMLAQMIAPPPEAKTPKDRDAYYAELATRASRDGLSLQQLLASGDVRLAQPRGDFRPISPEEMQRHGEVAQIAFEKATAEGRSVGEAVRIANDAAHHAVNADRIMRNAATVDAENAAEQAKFAAQESVRVEGLRAKVAADEAKYGPEGQAGFEKARMRIEAEGHEATAKAEEEMARVAADAAKAGEEMRRKADAAQPSTANKILGAVAMALGAMGQGLVGGPNQGLEAIKFATERQAKQLTDDAAIQKGIEISRYEQIKHNLQAKLAMGLSEQQNVNIRGLLGKIEMQQIEAQKQLSLMTRGNEKVQSAVIPARAASVSGGPLTLDQRLRLLREMRVGEKENVELRLKASEQPKKAEKAERGVLAGTTYHLENVTSSAEGHAARDKLKALDDMETGLQALEREAKNYGTRAWNPGRFENLVQEFAYDASNAKQQGVVRDPEMQQKLKSLGSWTGGQDVIMDMRSIVAKSRDHLLSQLGAVPAKR